ncbi:MAG TPA: hypothetical protein VL588_09325 [Bdellovibrionota bacterium]|nr:hypothetical protein [Bdellovibrionota bacterium]
MTAAVAVSAGASAQPWGPVHGGASLVQLQDGQWTLVNGVRVECGAVTDPGPGPGPGPGGPSSTCHLQKSGSYWAADLDGNIVGWRSTLDDALTDLNKLTSTGACRMDRTTCDLEKSGSYFAAQVGTMQLDWRSSLADALQDVRKLADAWVCRPNRAECKLTQSGSYWAVTRAGTQVSDWTGSLDTATSTLQAIRAAGLCQ